MREEMLPILARRKEIVNAIREHQVVVLAAETGAGKTTWVPRFLHEERFSRGGLIGVTQPRRVAAMSVAAYVSEQMQCELGTLVGYQIRHEYVCEADRTAIKFMTDGILLRELQADPLIEKYDVLVLDEMHERNLHQDFILALVKRALPRRPDLKVVVMSATINEKVFADYFGAKVVRIEGRQYPVEVEYLDGMPYDPIEAAVTSVTSALTRTSGDVLVFAPDLASIDKIMRCLGDQALGVEIHALYGDQSPEEQRRVFRPGGRRVIVATNIAETSITLGGVTAVVDTGLIKQMAYLPHVAMSSLQAVEHSRAGCDQRTGRAGRTAPGLCLRLYTRENYESREAFTSPEILRSSIEQVILQMKAMEMDDATIDNFDFLDAPSKEAFVAARATLHSIGAIDDEGHLTDDGHFMTKIPLPPIVTRMILSARTHGCVEAVVTIAASFSTRSIFVRPQDKQAEADAARAQFRDPTSDFLTVLNAVEAYRNSKEQRAFAFKNFLHARAIEDILATEDQICGLLRKFGIDISEGRDRLSISKSVASGLVSRLLVHNGGMAHSYQNASHDEIFIHPGSSLFKQDPPYLVAVEIVETTKVYARMLQAVTQPMLRELIPARELTKTPLRHYVRFHGDDPVVCCEVGVSWGQIRLGIEHVENIRGYEVFGILVKEIVETHVGRGWGWYSGLPGIHSSGSWHDHVNENIEDIRSFNKRFRSFVSPSVAVLTRFYCERLDGITAIEEALTRDLKMDLVSMLDESDKEAYLNPPTFAFSPAPETVSSDMFVRTETPRRERVLGETERLGTLAYEALKREVGTCPLCGRELTDVCYGPHDRRRLLFTEPTCVYLSLATDVGQEIARIVVHKNNGRVELQKNKRLLNWHNWLGKHFTSIDPKRRADDIIPVTVQDLEGFLTAFEELKRWRAEAERLKAEAAALSKEIARGHVARVTFESAGGGRPVAQHRGMTYIPPNILPYPEVGETWFCRLTTPTQSRPTAALLCKDMPSATEEEALVAEMIEEIRRTHGFVPSKF
ncbi:MAG: helicase-related protein [Patescibacteria group bacterium]|jgi:HrpA-like RNA helicase